MPSHVWPKSRYSAVSVWNMAKIVYTQITRNTHEPRMTIAIGTALFPRPREAASVLSMNAENA